MKLEGLTVEKVYSILDKVPPGKVYIKVLQSNVSEKIPVELNDALSKLQIEHHLLDKKMSGKSRSVGTASTLSGASGSSDSSGRCFQFSGLTRTAKKKQLYIYSVSCQMLTSQLIISA